MIKEIYEPISPYVSFGVLGVGLAYASYLFINLIRNPPRVSEEDSELESEIGRVSRRLLTPRVARCLHHLGLTNLSDEEIERDRES